MPRLIRLLALLCGLLTISVLAQQSPSPSPQGQTPAAQQPAPAAPSQTPPAAQPAPKPAPPQQATPTRPPQEREEEEEDDAERNGMQARGQGPPPPSLAAVPATAALITLTNVCPAAPKPQPGAKKPACVTKVTRSEFDQLIQAINPEMSPQGREQVAQGYARLLVMTAAAEKQHLERDPNVATLLHLSRMQALAQEFNKRLQKQAGQVTPQQLQQYYDEHQQQFLEAKLERIFVPKLSGEKQLDPAKQKELAEKLRAAAAAGGDFNALQKQAYSETELKQTPPPADMGVRRSGSIAPTQNEVVFSMKQGEVSQVLEDASGFYIYKVDSRNVLPLNNAEQEIRQRVARENYQNAMRAIFEPVTPELNSKYFGNAKITWNLPPAAGQTQARPAPAPPPSTVPPQKPR